MSFSGYTARVLALRTLFAGVLFASAHAVAFERMIVYSEKNVVSGLTAAQCVTLQDGKFSGFDVTTAFRIDLRAEYRITKIVYAGRPSAQCTQRMRGAQFKSSLDGRNFTAFHVVPPGYDISLTAPEMTTVDLSAEDVHARFVDVSGIVSGSVSEIQFWTDSDIVNVGETWFSGESPDGADYSVSFDVEGDFAEDATCSLALYVAASDLGDDLAAWESGAMAFDGGTRQGVGTSFGRVPAFVGGMNYVRAAISAETLSGETAVGFSPRVDAFSAANASNRMLVYSEKNIMSGLDVEKCKKLQDGQFSYGDITSGFRIDLQAEYRITKIVYAGRPSDQCTQRMRGVQFKASLDGLNFTTFHTVSQEYDISLTNPEMTTVTLLRDNVRARFLDVSGIGGNVGGAGSVSEIQFWTDSDVVIMDNVAFTQESAAGADYSVTARVDGNFAEDAPVSLTLYVAASDLGDDLGTWQAGATAIDGGTLAGGGTFTGHLQPVIAGGLTYVYAVVLATTLSGTTPVTHSTRASSFSSVSYEENRPLADSSDCRLKHYWQSDGGYKAFDGNDATVATAPYGGIDYGRDPAAWVAAGAKVVDLGAAGTGAAFATAPMAGVQGELRYGCVAAFVDGAATCVGTVFPFTTRDEAPLDITLDMVRAGGSSENVWRQGFFGNRNVIHVGDNNSNGKAVLSATIPHRITMVEWHDRLDSNCGGRAASANFWIYKKPGNLSDGVVIARGSSAVGASTPSVRGNRWMTVPVAGTQRGYAIGITDASVGDGFFRFYGARVKRALVTIR